MISSEKINADILSVYKSWEEETKEKNPYLFTEKFSNIFCPGVAEAWPEATMRILIVGEEATWRSRKYFAYGEDELQVCQRWILNDLESQLSGMAKPHSSPFWRRIRAMQKAFPFAQFCWANIDSINTDACGKLTEPDRKALHSSNTRLVRKIVDLADPTHIIFFGWHDTSLRHEFPELCDVVYPQKFGETAYMRENGYLLKTQYKGKPAIFTYHPSWLRANSKAYIERMIKML